METKTTMAQQLAARLNNDGQCWIDADGCDFEEIAVELGVTVEYAQRTGEYNDAGEMIYTAGSRSSHIADDLVRYAFPDGSAIIASGDAWDFEGKTPFSWAG